MARPANPNKEKIAEVKAAMKDNSKLVRAGETAAKKNEKLAERLAKLTGDTVVAPKTAKTQKVSSKKDTKEKVSKKDKKEKSKDKAKLQVVKKRGRPRKNTDEDEA